MALIQQAPPPLIEKINLAYEAITNIRKIVVKAGNDIAEKSFDDCIDDIQTVCEQVRDIADSPVMRITPDIIPENLRREIEETNEFPGAINYLLDIVLNTRDKDALNSAFTQLINAVTIMETKWKKIYDIAKPVPQEAPRKERTRGGRKHRTHRKRTRRARSQRKRTHRK